MRLALAVVGLTGSCIGSRGHHTIDAARFAPRATWSYAIPATAAAPSARSSQNEMIDDIAYLQHALDEAWAWSSRATIDTVKAIPGRLHPIPLTARDGAQLCRAIAEELRTTGIVLELDHRPCLMAPAPGPVGRLDTVPADRNYQLRLDREADHEVGILTISRFADPSDPGWQGFGKAMQQLTDLDYVIIDAQHAGGDDPRTGFAVLAALGLDNYATAYLRPASFRDGKLATIARANLHAASAPRDRQLWSSFPTDRDVARIARELVPRRRTTRPVATRFLVGPECGRGCQLMIALVRWQGIDLYGSFEDRMSGDEHGTIRLPHSGIVVTFPTAAYGPYLFGGPDRRDLPPDYARTLLAGLHELGHQRAESIAWRTRPLPNCATLPTDHAVLLTKAGGCRKPDRPGTIHNVTLSLVVETSTAKRFLVSCPGLTIGSAMELGVAASSQVAVTGTLDQIAQALSAPFVQTGSWPCEMQVEPN